MKIEFEGNSKIRGCSITNYLLEKSRVVWQSKGERSYHAFYQLFKGAKEREAYGIGADPEAFATLTKGGCTTVDAIDDAQEWDDQRAALDILDFSKDDQKVALGVVAATLHLGLAAFSADGDGSRVSDAACLAKAAPLLGVDAGKLAAALTTRTEQMGRGSMVTIKLSPPAAKDAADALAKALYGRLFDWLVVKINASISRGEGACHVGVLDIFGFEVFKVNSFEQLCINYTNEKLQLFFNDVVFGEEMKMYESEGVPHTHMAFEDNARCVALLDGKPVNLLSLLDDECSGGASAKDAKYGSKAINTFAQGPHKNAYFGGKDPSGRSFAVRHFAGAVTYDTAGFVEKNRDTISTTLSTLCMEAAVPLVAKFFAEPPAAEPASPTSPGGGRKKKKGAKTLGAAFRAQLHGLMDALKATQPHFVRCVKSNPGKKPDVFDGALCLQQLKYSGLFEAIKIRKAGYAYRVPHAVFAKRYALTAPRGGFDLVRKHGRSLPADVALACCENILNDPANLAALLAADGAKDAAAVMAVGKTRVFLKDALAQKALETRRAKAMESFVVLCQAAWRSFAARSKAGGGLAEARRKAKRDALRKQRAKAAGDLVTRWIRGARVRRSLAGARKNLAGLRAAAKRTAGAAVDDYSAMRDLDDALRPFLEAQTGPDGAPRADLGKCFAGPPKAGEPSAHLLAHLPAPVAREVAAAAASLYRLREGGKLLHAIADARAAHDVKKLRRLLKRADDLDLGDCEAVASARAEFEDIVKRAELVESLRRFVADPFGAQAPSGADLDVPKLLEEAARLGLASPDVDEARRRYEDVEPTLDARRELRHAVEGVHADGIDASLKRVLALLDGCDPAAAAAGRQWPELRAARAMRRMLKFEKLACAPSGRAKTKAQKAEPVLSEALLELCFRCELASDSPAAAAEASAGLAHAAGDDRDAVVRAYKWRAMFCTWLYPSAPEDVDVDALHAAAPPPSPPADAAPATPDRRYSDVSGASTPEASPTRRGGEDPAEALGAVVFEGLDVAAARRAYCAASFVDGTAAPPQIAAALAAPAAAWVPREGAFDAARGPRSPRPDALSARAPLDAGPSRRAPDYPGISRQEASDLAKSRANLKKSRAALQRTNKKLHIVTGVHAARRRKSAWHP